MQIIITTVHPSATTTTTTTETDTTTTTVTATSAVPATATSVVDGPTLYAACGSKNFADTVSGNIVIAATRNGDVAGGVTVISSSSAYDCCVSGLLSGDNTDINTSATLYNDGTCILLTDDTCASQAANTYAAVFSDTGAQFTLSNSNCGQITTSQDVATLGDA